eukprot:1232662-Amphidinium_carterae.1
MARSWSRSRDRTCGQRDSRGPRGEGFRKGGRVRSASRRRRAQPVTESPGKTEKVTKQEPKQQYQTRSRAEIGTPQAWRVDWSRAGVDARAVTNDRPLRSRRLARHSPHVSDSGPDTKSR